MNHCEILCDPNIRSYSFSDYSMLHIYVVVKEYERVVGWEGSDAVSPRDGAAWVLRIPLRYSCIFYYIHV